MGFFLKEGEEPAPLKKPSRRPDKQAFRLAEKGCDACSHHGLWPKLLSPRMATQGSPDADILILGLAPSMIDDREGKLWSGPSADKILMDALPGRYKSRIAYQSMLRCSTGSDARPYDAIKDAHACSIHLEADIENSKIKYIIGVGDLPLRFFAPSLQMREVYGLKMPIRIGSRILWYFPVFDPYFVWANKNKYNDGPYAAVFRGDLKVFFREFETWGKPSIPEIKASDVLIPSCEQDALDILARMAPKKGVDIETNCLKPMIKNSKILSAAFSDGSLTMAFSVDHPEGPTSWGASLLLREIKTNPWIAHNANFELIWFMHLAEMLREPAEFMPYDDSMAMGRLKHKRSMALSLDDMSMITTGVNVKALTSVNAANIMAYPLAEILPYNGLDAWGSAQIERLLLPGIMDEHEENYKRFIDSIYATAGMEYMGLDIDLRASENQRSEWATEKAAAYSDSRQIYEVKQFEKELQREFNIGSADDVGEALVTFGKIPLPKTGGGKQYKTDEDTLTALAPDNPLVKAVLRYRGATKMIETYIEPIASVPAVYRDGKVHPGYTTMLTATTRLSSNGPNIQNFPKRKHKELREQIIAPPGHLLYAFDFGQLEARVIAMVTKDKVLCQSIIDGRDIHSDWLNNCLSIYPDYLNRLAEETNQTEEKKIRKAGRDIIKTHFVFASFFGSSSKSVSDLTRIPLPLVNELHEDFWAEFRGVKAWIKDRRAVYDATGSMHLLTGIERHTINFGGNETINTPVQGTAACLVVDAMNELAWTARETNDCYIHPRVNIHDDLMFILPEDPDKAEPYIQGIMETMVQVRYPWQIVPLMIEAKLGPSWADLEEFTTYTGDYYRGR